MDINKVWISGLAVSEPVFTQLPSGSGSTPFTNFTLQVNEVFTDREGETRTKANFIRIEALGRSAETTAKKVQKGNRYYIDGYIRQDRLEDGDHVKVRVFAVYKDDTHDQVVHAEALKAALDIVLRSRDKDSAVKTLEGLIAG